MTLLETRELSKTFPGVIALDGVNIKADEGEVRALVGANGAGKSTLMNILAGVFPPSGGEVRLAGEPVAFDSPRAAREQGISIVYQDSSSIPELTVAKNVFLGREPVGRLGFIDNDRLEAQTRELLERFHLPLDADAPVEELGVASRQLVEIARALSFSARILILDEPTAVLSLREQENLFDIIAKLKRAGLLVLYVSHRIDEVFAIADRATVLRDGCEVATVAVGETSHAELVRMMTGRDARRVFSLPEIPAGEEPLLRVRFSRGAARCEVTLAEGEILGLAGMVGAGRSWFARRLVGLSDRAEMTVEVAGRRVSVRSPRQALRHGIVYITEDRKREGTFSNLSVIGNTTAASLDRFSSFGFLARRRERSQGGAILDRLGLVARSLIAPARQLSGGNQQKLLLARALLAEPKVLICDEPTRGIDVGAKEEIYEILIELASKGVGIILISSEFKELLAVTHRLLVMRDGAIVAEMATRDADEHTVLAAATGVAASSELEPRNAEGEDRPAMSE